MAGAIYLGLHLFSAFRVGLSSCLPADFPHYPRATIASIVISDSLGDCTIQYRTRDTSSDVMGFFETNLNEGDWMVMAVDEQSGLIRFQRNSNPNTIGYVKVLSFPGQQTQFQIQIRARQGLQRRRSAISAVIITTNESRGMSTFSLARFCTLTCPAPASFAPTTAM